MACLRRVRSGFGRVCMWERALAWHGMAWHGGETVGDEMMVVVWVSGGEGGGGVVSEGCWDGSFWFMDGW